ncbi:MAG: glycosyltransferase, partial [Chloroflexota bacterium]|nr:glycosyltransferase [Chloroflexota bacterium]
MYKGKTVGVVVPAYNEEKLISHVIETMPVYVDHVVVVDDGSKDNTATIVDE